MPYTLQQAVNPMCVMERQWGKSPMVMFTDSAECIGVLARDNGKDQIIGILLSMYDDDGEELFSSDDVGTVVDVLAANGYDASSVILVGAISSWTKMLEPALYALMSALKPVDTQELPDGTYGAKIDSNGNIQVLR